MTNWQQVKLCDALIINPIEKLSKGTIAKKVSMERLRPFCRDVLEYEFDKFSGGSKFRNKDTIMARITPCLENGKRAQINMLEQDEIGFGSTEFIIFREKENISNSNFIYYLICSDLIREPAIKSMVGSSGRQRVQIDVLKELIIPLPPLDIQKKIAGVLGALDDKIELNNKINNNLEQQAQTLFKSWFVDFEPFGGKMPDDWKVGNLLDIADYLNGLAMQKFRPAENDKGLPVLKIKELRQGFCDSNSELCSLNVKNEYIVNDGDVIFSWSGSLLVDFWCGGKCGLNQHLFKVTSKNFDKWFYFLWTKHYLEHFAFIAADKATTMGHIKREELEKAKVIIPSSECYQKMKQIMTPIYNLLISNRVENTRLSALRDTLLPKLMSGEIDVSNVDISALTSADKLSFNEGE